MFGKRINLFRLLGFEVRIDLSWIIIAILVAWSLSTGLFPFHYKNLSARAYWLMGIFGALGLFVSIVVHEFSHSLVARRFGMPMRGITLFIFGGVAEMEDEPPTPRAEFLMAIVGPLSSIAIAGLFYGMYLLGTGGWPQPIIGVVNYLAVINAVLAGFNLLPAFPLDGGRVLRSILWGWKQNLRWSTRVAAQVGSGFGIALIALGVLQVLFGNFVAGMWWFLIGMFLQSAAKGSYQQLVTRKALEGEQVRRFMKTNPVTVPRSTSIQEFVEDYVYRYHFKMFPVVDREKLFGCITTRQVKEIPREEWRNSTVGQLAEQCQENTISPDADAMQALSLMRKNNASRLMVTADGQLLGVITLKDMLEFLSVKTELDEEAS